MPNLIIESAIEGMRAARKNLLPASILILIGILLIILFLTVEPANKALNHLGTLKQQLGFMFSVPSTIFFGAVIPTLLRRWFLNEKESLFVLFFYACFWGYKGVEIDLLYHYQGILWQNAHPTIALIGKVAIDQFIYVPLLTVPPTIFAFGWKANNFSLNEFKKDFRATGYFRPAIRLMVSNWLLWIPAVSIIYFFPTPLQLPLQNVTLSIWMLLLILLTHKKPA